MQIITIDKTAEIASTDPWKDIELTRLFNEECQHYEAQLELMQQDLNRIKRTVIDYMDLNELESPDERFPIQFFNLNAIDADIRCGAFKEQIESERRALEKMFLEEKSRIENIKQIMWDCFETKPQKLQGIYTEIFIQNFPLTNLDEKLSDESILKRTLESPELFQQVCEVKPWIHPNIVIKGVIEWPAPEPSQPSKMSDRFSAFASKIIDQQLTSNVNLDYNFFSTFSMESENINVNNETLVNAQNIRIYVSSSSQRQN